MSNLREIQEAIQALSAAEQAELRQWFAEFDAVEWDAQIERDAKAGKLDGLAAEALAEYRVSSPREL